MASIESMFELAMDLRDNGNHRDSINVLSKILTDYPNDKREYMVYLYMGANHSALREYDEYLINAKKASDLNPKYEFASLCVYLAFAKLNRDDDAIAELMRYLKEYPAKLYKDTLEELLEGLEDGYMTNYEIEIRNPAKLNGVKLNGH